MGTATDISVPTRPSGLGTAGLYPWSTSAAGGRPAEGGLVIPRFEFPWPPACHPDAESAERETLVFAARHGLAPDADHWDRLVRTKYGWLAARCYPQADREFLQITADYFTWFFIADDLFVDRVETVTPQTLPRLTAMIDVLDYNRPGAEPVFGEYAWLEVCTRLRRRLSHEHFQRFAHGMRMWASTAGLQIINHLQDEPCDIPQYETIRRHTSGTNPCLSLLDAANTGPLKPAEYNDPIVQRLCHHANNVICWSNDIQSVQIEMNQPGQHWNMVTLFHRKGLTLQQSVDLVAHRVRSEIASFQVLATSVEPLASVQLRGFITGLRNWMRGYQDWVDYDTERYSAAYVRHDADDRGLLT